VAFGLTEGTSNLHPGQGTANRRFFFYNAMLELMWVRDEREVRSPPIAPTRLWERWRYCFTGYSPFGICLRPSVQHAVSGRPATLPFTTWECRRPYLPPELRIDVATGTAASEPLVFATPFSGRPDALPEERRQPLVHPKEVVEIESGNDHLAEIEFDHGSQGQSADFRPLLPLRFRW